VIELRWKTSVSASCLHAAACHRAGIPAADPHYAAALDEPSAALVGEIAHAGWPVDSVIAELAAFAPEYENNRELVTRALTRLRIPPNNGGTLVRVAGAIADLEAALVRSQPQLVDELAVRGEPLRQQWEARGPGLLREVVNLTDEGVVPDAAEVVLVLPYAGGHGMAYPRANRVTFEAMLFSLHADLPEVVRLAWLLAQLNSDLPRYSDALPPGHAAGAVGLAVATPVLAGAELVELARCDEATLAKALEAWRIPSLQPADAAARLWVWWSTWLEHPKNWPVAVAALDQMLAVP